MNKKLEYFIESKLSEIIKKYSEEEIFYILDSRDNDDFSEYSLYPNKNEGYLFAGFEIERAKVIAYKNKIVASNPERQNQLRSLIAEEKRLEKDTVTEKIETEDQIFLKISDIEEIPNSKVILAMHLDELDVNENILVKDINLSIIGKKKLVILGRNGSGKTTLLKKILEILKQTPNIKVGYMPQNYDEVLNKYSKVLDFLSENNTENITRIRSLLGMLKFTSEEMLNDISNLSGGQKAKIFLCYGR